jgi:hypothetical protein
MQLNLKYQVIILVVTLGIGILIGSLSHKPDTTTHSDVKSDKETHEHTETTITKKRDGTTITKIDTIRDSDTSTKTDVSTTLKPKSLNLSASVGVSIHDPLLPVYGIHLTKPIFSNFTVGGYVLTNGTVGVTIGYDF